MLKFKNCKQQTVSWIYTKVKILDVYLLRLCLHTAWKCILPAENYVSALSADTPLDHSWEAWLLSLTDYHAQTSKYILELEL